MEYLQYDEEELDFQRDQFTFYYSFLKGIRRIQDLQERGVAYDAICDYAFHRIEPDEEQMTPMQMCVFDLVFPVLDSARKKSLSGMKHGKSYQSKKQTRNKKGTNKEQTRNEGEIEKEIEIEKELEIEIEREKEGEPLSLGRDRFQIFWNLYPRKVGMDKAKAVFERTEVPFETMMEALEKQVKCGQWVEDGGRYVPHPAKWLEDRRWEDELPVQVDCHGEVKASGVMGQAERDALARMLADG